jgi:hypothetical protein
MKGSESGYSLRTLHALKEMTTHYVDIVVIHDYDETTDNWVYYQDAERLLRQQVDNIKMEVTHVKQGAEAKLLGGHDPDRRGSKVDLHDPQSSNPPPQLHTETGNTTSEIPSASHPVAVEARPTKASDVTSSLRPIPEEHLQVRARWDSVSGPQIDLNPTRTPSPTRPDSACNWLSDAEMLPKTLPGARVLAFSYPKLRTKEGGQAGFFERAAKELLTELAKARESDKSQSHIPLVLVAAGFGGLVVQRAIALRAAKPVPVVQKGESPNQEKAADPELERLTLPDLAQTTDIVFFDTPFPDGKKEEALKGFFPKNIDVRMRAIVQIMERMEVERKGLTVEKVWDEFWKHLGRSGQETRISWFYSAGPEKLPRSTSLDSRTITLNPLFSQRRRRLTNFPNSSDKSYKRVIACLRKNLMVKAVGDKRHTQLRLDLMKGDFPVNPNTADERGRTLLHLAVLAANPEAVNLLLGNGAKTQAQDLLGRTPLHHAILMFCQGADQESEITGSHETQQDYLKSIQDIISQLLDYTRKTELHSGRDKDGAAPKDLIHDSQAQCPGSSVPCRHCVIRKLLENHQPIMRKHAVEQPQDPWRGWSPPKRGLAYNACVQARAIVAEFYETAGDKADAKVLLADFDSPNIFDLIYRKDQGPVKVLSKMTARHVVAKGDVCCRWIHVPANNVRSTYFGA